MRKFLLALCTLVLLTAGAGALNLAAPVLNGLNIVVAAALNGSVALGLPAWLGMDANLVGFGADPTGAKSATAALNAACATGRKVRAPAGTYLLTDLSCTLGTGQVIEGDGDGLTVFHVPSTFNLSAVGVVRMAAVQPAGTVRGVSFVFDQPDTASRAALISYPPAIYTEGAPRARVQHVRCQAATVCIDAKGNAGGLLVEDLQSSAFAVTVDLDGSVDTVRLNDLHIWPFGLTANQQAVLGDGNTFGVRSGRMDDLKIDGLLAYDIGHAVFLFDAPASSYSSGGPTFGSATNLYLDDASALTCSGPGGGWFDVASGYATVGRANFQTVRVDGCEMSITGFRFLQTAPSNTPMVQVLDTTGEARLTIGSSNFNMASSDVTAIGVVQTSSVYADLHDLTFFRTPNLAYNNPTIVTNGAWRGSIHDITANDKGTGSGTLLYSMTDGWYSIHHIKPVGWGLQLVPNPTTATIDMGTPAVLQATRTNAGGAGAAGAAAFIGGNSAASGLDVKLGVDTSGQFAPNGVGWLQSTSEGAYNTPLVLNPAGGLNIVGSGGIAEPAVPVPGGSGSSCYVGQHAWDGSYDYRCVATNHWRRSPAYADF